MAFGPTGYAGSSAASIAAMIPAITSSDRVLLTFVHTCGESARQTFRRLSTAHTQRTRTACLHLHSRLVRSGTHSESIQHPYNKSTQSYDVLYTEQSLIELTEWM